MGEIKPREIIVSISIVAIMLLFGLQIHEKIQASQIDANEKYNKAVKIESTDLFQYGMDTNVGNAFVYGDLLAIDTVTFPEIGGNYMYVEKVKEKYTRHTRTVTKTRTVNGKTQTYTETETYWSWDYTGSEEKKCNEVSFCGIVFSSNKINLPYEDYIDTIKESSRVRYKYYGVGTQYTGTIFTDLRDKTISDYSSFYNNMNIEEAVEYLENDGILALFLFWIFWIGLIVACVYGFCYLDNKWLD